VSGPRRLEQVRLVPQSQHPVVVHEVHVAVERERTQVGEVVEAVALQPRAELELERDADGEARRQQRTGGATPFRRGDRDRGAYDRGGTSDATDALPPMIA
jgi:hypothetical protein